MSASTLASDRAPLLKPWSAKDEAELRDAQRRIDEAQARRTVAIEKVRAVFAEMGYGMDTDCKRAIQHAEAIRDALAPFDSGIRVGEVSR